MIKKTELYPVAIRNSGMILYIALSIFNPFKFGYFMGKIAPVKPFIAMKSADSYPF